MKTTTTTMILLLLSLGNIFAQIPKIYINFVTHNEPGDNLQAPLNFNITVPKVLQLANLMDSKGASWNLQTCDGFPTGALNLQGATSNIFRTLQQSPYSDNIEIDPRNKQTIYPEIADLYHILDSLGANPTTTLGGFLYFSNVPNPLPDWFQYEDTIIGGTYTNVKWKCNLIWGAGSTSPPHINDLNDYGVWKPDTTIDFYTHNPNRNVWYMGSGCQPLLGLDTTENEQTIISTIKGAIDSIQNNLWPSNKFYVYTVTFNQSQFGPTLFQKVSTICDSVNSWGTSKIQWATLTEKLDSFNVWQQNPNDYSQWLCGETTTPVEANEKTKNYKIFPNPFNDRISIEISDTKKHKVEFLDLFGRTIHTIAIQSDISVDLSNYLKGIYFIRIDGRTEKIIKY